MKVLVAYFIAFQMIFAPTIAFSDSHNRSFFKNPIFTPEFYSPKSFALAGQMVWVNNTELRVRAQQKAWDVSQFSQRKARGQIGHVGQTMLILWIIHGIAIVKDEVEQARLQGREVDWDDIEVMFGETFEHMVNSPEIWMSMIGASIAGSTIGAGKKIVGLIPALDEAKDAMKQVLSSSAAQTHFKTLLVSGAMSLVTFVGWEAGMILWQDSLLYMGDNYGSDAKSQEQAHSDLEIARNIKFSRLASSFISHRHLSEDERRVYTLMKQNMYSILINDHGKRWKWFYNTWRKRIATGDFVLLVSAMTVGAWAGGIAGAKAGAAIGAVGGIPGMLVMGFFGLTAGVVAGALVVFVPQWVKDGISEFVRDMRINNATQILDNNQRMQMRYVKIFSGDSFRNRFMRSMLLIDFEDILKERRKWRDRFMNAWVERYHNSIIAKQFATFNNSIAAMSTDPDFNQKLQEFIVSEEQEEVAGQGLQAFIQANQDTINELLDEVDYNQPREELNKFWREIYDSGVAPTKEDTEKYNLLQIQYKRAQQVEVNRETIQRANERISESVEALYNFYSQDAKELTDTYISETWNSENDDRLPEELELLVRKEIDQVTWMHQNLLHILLGFHPEMNEQLHEQERLSQDQLLRVAGPARILLNLYFEFGYYEEEVIQMIQESKAAAQSATSTSGEGAS